MYGSSEPTPLMQQCKANPNPNPNSNLNPNPNSLPQPLTDMSADPTSRSHVCVRVVLSDGVFNPVSNRDPGPLPNPTLTLALTLSQRRSQRNSENIYP